MRDEVRKASHHEDHERLLRGGGVDVGEQNRDKHADQHREYDVLHGEAPWVKGLGQGPGGKVDERGEGDGDRDA